jgi:hypothetical protein
MTAAGILEELLAEEDVQHLKDKGYIFEVERAAGFICVVIRNFPLPAGYNPQTTDFLLRLPPNFPMACPDMFWTFPHVRLANAGLATRKLAVGALEQTTSKPFLELYAENCRKVFNAPYSHILGNPICPTHGASVW